MKRLLATLLVFVAVMYFPCNSHAETGPENVFVIGGGLNFAVSPEVFTDYYVMGYGLSVGMDFRFTDQWSMVGFIDWKMFLPAEGMILDWYTEPGEYPGGTGHEVSEGMLNAVTFGLSGKGRFKSATATTYPIIRGGFGLTVAGAEEIKVSYVDNNGAPAVRWHAGASSETHVSVLVAFGVEFASRGSGNFVSVELGLHALIQEESSPAIAFVAIGFSL